MIQFDTTEIFILVYILYQRVDFKWFQRYYTSIFVYDAPERLHMPVFYDILTL